MVHTNYWLLKSEAGCYSIDDLERDTLTAWTGVRNYQARNFIKNDMNIGDMILFYHSGGISPAIVGTAKIVSAPHVDPTAQHKMDEHYDSKSTATNPIWWCVDVAFTKKFQTEISLRQIKQDTELKHMVVAQKGSRLSIQPVSQKQFNRVIMLSQKI